MNTLRHLRLEDNTLYLSEIFKWYEDDYVQEAGSIQEFIKAYADQHVLEKLQDAENIGYIDYDWSLNRPENFPGLVRAD